MALAGMRGKVLSGIKWNTISVVATKSTDFLVMLILARLLVPEAYGIVGMAMLVVGILEVVSDMGLYNALIQKKEDELTEVRYSSALWFLLVVSLLLVLCFFLFISPAGAAFYNEPRLVPILNALSIYLFFNISSIIPRVILTRKLNFKSLVTITFLGTAISSVAAVVMALLGFGVWSLVTKYIAGSGVILVSYWVKVGWSPKFVFRKDVLLDMAGYSVYTQLNNVLHFLRKNLDYLIIGKLVSSHLLGIYTLAFMLSLTLKSQLYSIFNKVFFPVYSKLQDDPEKIKMYYLQTMRMTAIITFPISVLFIGLAEEIVLFFFGAKWLEAASPLRILSVAAMIFAISGTPAEVLKGIGKPSVSFYLNTINTFVIALPLIYFGQKYFGIDGVAYAVCIHYTTSRIAFHYFMKKYIHITDLEVMYALKDPALAALVMLVIIYLITLVGMAVLVELLVAGIIGGLVYLMFFLDDLKQGIKLIKKY
ncbi:lipopolysaccharide biosynthesis protein [Pontibacter lucknowensis]|uniref:Membrane protein involved in the export of O-antigen and teichoic acid n=1 Tax=Pontibacter lucknowensis TaxID=1077936 RepID=A0A1N7AY65_9BACT|nr:lipopolysaccharide biosynthesis protein [Pontibacter lucknowensis]SIR44055.1 Membrane protein involved in the export of O-antigen and teichoic acid [Pontibacter lucknowensis]